MLLFVRNKTKPGELGHKMKNRPVHHGDARGEVSARMARAVTEITIVLRRYLEEAAPRRANLLAGSPPRHN